MSSLIASTPTPQDSVWKTLAEFSLPSQPGSDQLAQEQAAVAVQRMNLSPTTLARLKNAVAEATLNTIEHSHHYQPDLPIFIRVLILEQVSGDGLGQDNEPPRYLQTLGPRSKTSEGPARPGWGFFLIHKLGEGFTDPEETHYTLELFLYQEED
jgi:anti-sigma regulatory factor (Ser/Thr protein kinase)